MRPSIVLATICVLSTAQQQKSQGRSSDAVRIARVVDSIATQAIADGLAPALGVAVTLDGRTVLAKSYGMTDTDAGLRADDQTLWYLASTSKSLTGFGVSLLASDGAISFDAPINRLLPAARWHPDARPDQLTLARFLSHTHHLDDDAVVMSAAFTGAIPEAEWPRLLTTARPTGSSDLVYRDRGW